MFQQVIDYEEWFLNLTEANANDNPQWKQLLPSMNQAFGMTSQTPSEYNSLLERMKTDDALFQKFMM